MRHPHVHTALFSAGLIASSACLAQSRITLYGIADVALRAGDGLSGNNVAGLSKTEFGTHAFGTQYGPSGYADNFYRLDNTLKYTGAYGPWQARAAYSSGEQAGDASTLSSHGVALAYQGVHLTVSGATNLARNDAVTGPDKTVHQRVLSAGLSHEAGHGVLVTQPGTACGAKPAASSTTASTAISCSWERRWRRVPPATSKPTAPPGAATPRASPHRTPTSATAPA